MGRDSDCSFEACPCADLDELEPRRATPPGPTSEAVEAVVVERQDVPRHFRETSPENLLQEIRAKYPDFPVPTKAVISAFQSAFPSDEPAKPRGLAGDSAARKDAPVYEGFMCYFPNAIAECARLSKFGNDKHNAGQPLHWSFNKSNDHGNCLGRHQLQAEEIDPETGEAEFLHAVMVAWRGMAQLETLLLKRHPELKPGKNVRGAR